MNSRINHNTAVDVDFDNLLAFLVVCHAFVTFVVDALQRNKLLATFNEVAAKLLFVLVIFQRIAVETGDLAGAFEGSNIAVHSA